MRGPVRLGVITGSGVSGLAGLMDSREQTIETPHGPGDVTTARLHDTDVIQVSRHGPGHLRLSNQVNHRANIWALHSLGATAVIGCTACGAVDPTLSLGSLVVFDDLHFLANRLPNGELCTFFTEAGDPDRAHWILQGGPYSPGLRRLLVQAAAESGLPARDGGVYGHVDGPRFNTPAEIAALAACGVVAVSQTAGPETVLCGELELPYALVGFVTDYANEVRPGETTPVQDIIELMGRSGASFAAVISAALAGLPGAEVEAAGTVYRFGPS